MPLPKVWQLVVPLSGKNAAEPSGKVLRATCLRIMEKDEGEEKVREKTTTCRTLTFTDPT
jgi:hypothetical protein